MVYASLTLEFFIKHLQNNDDVILEEMTGLLVLARLWRFLRVGHAIFASTSMASEAEVKHMAAELRQLEQEYTIALEKAAAKA